MSKHTIIGLGLAKSIFHLASLDGKRKKLRRGHMLPFFVQLPPKWVKIQLPLTAKLVGVSID